jgi:hypothetical protein
MIAQYEFIQQKNSRVHILFIVLFYHLLWHNYCGSFLSIPSDILGTKNNFMGNKGKPSGRNKPAGTGTPSDFHSDELKKDARLTKKYTEDDKNIAGQVRTGHRNRNVNKTKATNAGGYKN